jgi:hypothetical protein
MRPDLNRFASTGRRIPVWSEEERLVSLTALVLRTRRPTRPSRRRRRRRPFFGGFFSERLPKRLAIALRTSLCTSSRMTVMRLL